MLSLKRADHDYYQAQQQIHTTGSDPVLRFFSGCSEGQINLYEGLCHDVIHDYIEEQARC